MMLPPADRVYLACGFTDMRKGSDGLAALVQTALSLDPYGEAAVTRLIGALLLAQNDEWAVQRARYMSLETIAPLSDAATVNLPPLAA